MSTPAQIHANQANSQLSSGPSTEEGKARSSRNAVSHGLTSRDVYIAADEQELFQSLKAGLESEISPAGAVETDLFEKLLLASWKMHRIRRMETEIFELERDPVLNPETAKALDRLNRYHAEAERSYYRALKMLRELQTNRVLHDSSPDPLVQSLPALVKVEKLKKQNEAKSPARPADTPATPATPNTDYAILGSETHCPHA